jgi:hypothetical protein
MQRVLARCGYEAVGRRVRRFGDGADVEVSIHRHLDDAR